MARVLVLPLTPVEEDDKPPQRARLPEGKSSKFVLYAVKRFDRPPSVQPRPTAEWVGEKVTFSSHPPAFGQYSVKEEYLRRGLISPSTISTGFSSAEPAARFSAMHGPYVCRRFAAVLPERYRRMSLDKARSPALRSPPGTVSRRAWRRHADTTSSNDRLPSSPVTPQALPNVSRQRSRRA